MGGQVDGSVCGRQMSGVRWVDSQYMDDGRIGDKRVGR